MNRILRILSLAALVGLAAGCDNNEELILSKGRIEGAEIRVIRNVNYGTTDTNTIEIYDRIGNLKAEFKYPNLPGGFIIYDDNKKVTLRGNEAIVQKEASQLPENK